jgi:hypothetical protein
VGCIGSPKLNRFSEDALLRLAGVSSSTLLDFRCSAWLEKKVVFQSPKITMTDSYIMSNIFGFDLFIFLLFFMICIGMLAYPTTPFWGRDRFLMLCM